MPLESALRWLIALRILSITTLLFAALIIQVTTAIILPIDYLYYLTAATYVLSLVHIALRQLVDRPKVEAGIQLGSDLVIITALLHFTNGVELGLSFLYLITIGTAAALFYRRGAFLTASGAAILYGTLVDLKVLGVLPNPRPARPLIGPPEPPNHWSPAEVWYNIVVNILGFYGLALLTSYLTEKLRSTREELEARRNEFDRMRAFATEVVSSLASGLLTLDSELRITFVNGPAAALLAEGPSIRWLGREGVTSGLFPAEQLDRLRLTADAGGRGGFEAELTPPDGGRREVAGSFSRLTDGSGRGIGYIVLFDDVTELRSLEGQLRMRERMAAVGEMAAGIAHEIRNPLASIAGSVQVLRGESGLSPDGEKLSGIVLRESSRLNRIIEEFLRYVRPPDRRPQRFDVAAHLQELLALLRNSAGVATALRVVAEPPSFEIVADPDQVRQVLWNVASNGLRAMPAGGKLTIEGRPAAGYYSISVTDTGFGMTADERSRLFQPFKTNFDGGSGLGLAIVYRIVEEHGGRIVVESEPGRGTLVRIDLPVAGVPGEAAPEAAAARPV